VTYGHKSKHLFAYDAFFMSSISSNPPVLAPIDNSIQSSSELRHAIIDTIPCSEIFFVSALGIHFT